MNYENEVERFEVSGLTVRIVHDDDASSPRENDNLGTMVCWHNRYSLGDDGVAANGKRESREFATPEDFQEWADLKESDVAIVLPLYLYDHSGISISCAEFSCPWDSGQVGYIYITREKIRSEYSAKRITKKLLDRVRGYLVSEVKNYDDYLTGQCFGYVVEDENGEHLDSCWGFIGDLEYVRNEAKDSAKWHAADIAKREAEVSKLLNTGFAL